MRQVPIHCTLDAICILQANCIIRSWLQVMFRSQKFSPNVCFSPILLHLTMDSFYWTWKFSAVHFVCGFPWTGMCNLVFHSDKMQWLDSHNSAAPKDTVANLYVWVLWVCNCCKLARRFWKDFINSPFSLGNLALAIERKNNFIPGS